MVPPSRPRGSQLRRPLVFGVVFGLTTFLSVNVSVQAEDRSSVMRGYDVRWEALAPDEKAMVDRMAADFYQDTLRHAQASAIEENTLRSYLALDPVERAEFRSERRKQWREMSEEQRQALRNSETPNFYNLTEEQKRPFRSHALDMLGGQGALNESALQSAMRHEV